MPVLGEFTAGTARGEGAGGTSRSRSCAEGSKEDAHEQRTIQAAGLTPLLPSAASSVPIYTSLEPAPWLDPEFTRGLSQAASAPA